MKDAIDIGLVKFYDGPVDVSGYAATVDLTGVEFHPADDRGVRFIFDRATVNARWPDFTLPGWDGPLQWTLYAGFQVGGQWQMGGFHEMWSDRGGKAREWTGAHPAVKVGDKTHWQANWAYDRNRFGDLCGIAPYEGISMALMMVAGGARPGTSDHPTVRERSNIIVVPVRMSGMELVQLPTVPPAPSVPDAQADVPPASAPNSTPGVPASVDLSPLLAELKRGADAAEASRDALVRIAAAQERSQKALDLLARLWS